MDTFADVTGQQAKGVFEHSTTMAYYVELDSASLTHQLWEGWGDNLAAANTCGNTRPDGAKKPEEVPADEAAETSCNQ